MGEFINFEVIRNCIKINDKNLFYSYLKDIYKDLSERSENKTLGISKLTFYNYIKLPVFITDKLFEMLDKDNDGFLCLKEFTDGLYFLYIGSFEECVKSVFDIYDFDKDGQIVIGDLKVILSCLPLKSENSEIKFQMDYLKELDEMLENTFENRSKLNFTEYLAIIEKKKSDSFIQLICLLYDKRPFSDQNVNMYKILKNSLKSIKLSSPKKNLPSPSQKSLSSSIDSLLNQEKVSKFKNENIEISGKKGMIRRANKLIASKLPDHSSPKATIQEQKSLNSDLDFIIKNSNSEYESPSIFFSNIAKNIDNISLEENDEIFDPNSFIKDNLTNRGFYENIIYKFSENKTLKSYWLMCQGTEIMYYKDKKKDCLLGIHNLTGCFIKDTGHMIIDKVKYYSFSILFPNCVRNYFTKEKDVAKEYVTFLKQASGHVCFFDYYEIKENIGEGRFGLVKLGIHLKTQQKVAIKLIKKTSMSKEDLELVRFEIDIMKLCRHENIVRLLDHFENDEFIFIVMELLSGGDLNTFLKNADFKITEEFASKLVFQIASGLKYIHSFGIVHRDLKPENIMLTEKFDIFPKLKIMDFGLSKILGPDEKLVDGYGTLTFVAPEVLIRQPYNNQIDIWSLGIILYYSLSGILPFDNEDDNEEVIAQMTVFEEVCFPSKQWINRSYSVINLINRCLIKEPEKRIIIEEFLNDEWIKKFNKFK